MPNKIEEIGKLFLERRIKLGLTQEQLGERAGVSNSEIAKIENGRGIPFSTLKKISDALDVTIEIKLITKEKLSQDAIHYMIMVIGMFARQHNLTRKEACNYLCRYKGLDFVINNYEVESQLSLQDCVDDCVAICKRNGGLVG